MREGASKVAVWCGTPGGDRLRRMLRWLVPLTGSEADLDRLVEWPDVEDWKIVRHEKHGAVLCGERFEALDDYETVEEVAETLLAVINRTASFVLQGDFQGAHRDHIVEQRQEGDHVIMFAETGIYTVSGVAAKLTWTKHAPDGSVIETPEDREREPLAENYAKLIPLLEAYPDLTDALRYMKEEPDLRGYYKVGEAILRALGKPKKWDTLVGLGWTTDDELRRFTKSTHERRHHAATGPDKPMNDSEARAFVRALLDKLIVHLHRAGP